MKKASPSLRQRRACWLAIRAAIYVAALGLYWLTLVVVPVALGGRHVDWLLVWLDSLGEPLNWLAVVVLLLGVGGSVGGIWWSWLCGIPRLRRLALDRLGPRPRGE